MQAPSDFDLSSDEVRRLGHLAVEAAAVHRESFEAGPAFGRVGEKARMFDEPLPEEGLPFEQILTFVPQNVLPIHVEDRVVKWLAQVVGLPSGTEGIVTSGGSMANFTCLAAARRAQAPGDIREEGMGAPGVPRIVVYASDQAHNCVDKAVDLLGIGWRQLRTIPTDERFRMRIDLLKAAVAEDRRSGLRPAIVVGNAGTVNTSAVDPLEEIADFCGQEGLWFHADGAYGAMATISHQLRPLFKGLERADSVAADPHKWLYVPYAAGVALVREPGSCPLDRQLSLSPAGTGRSGSGRPESAHRQPLGRHGAPSRSLRRCSRGGSRSASASSTSARRGPTWARCCTTCRVPAGDSSMSLEVALRRREPVTSPPAPRASPTGAR